LIGGRRVTTAKGATELDEHISIVEIMDRKA